MEQIPPVPFAPPAGCFGNPQSIAIAAAQFQCQVTVRQLPVERFERISHYPVTADEPEMVFFGLKQGFKKLGVVRIRHIHKTIVLEKADRLAKLKTKPCSFDTINLTLIFLNAKINMLVAKLFSLKSGEIL
jgi:hypothetical protein